MEHGRGNACCILDTGCTGELLMGKRRLESLLGEFTNDQKVRAPGGDDGQLRTYRFGRGAERVCEVWSLRIGSGASRPLLAGLDRNAQLDKLQALSEERRPAYEQAEIVADASRAADAVVDEIVAALHAR